jgi:uncharacterized protein HemY
MRSQFELSLSFTDPTPESALEVIANLEIHCDALGLTFKGQIFTDPLTEQEREALQWYLEEYWQWPFGGFAERGQKIEQFLYKAGRRIYASVFASTEAQNILQQWRQQQNAHHCISIVSDIARVLSLPWELLCDEQGFLILHSSQPVSILRRVPVYEQVTNDIPFEPPLRILLVTSRPTGIASIDPRIIARELVDEVQEHIDTGILELEFLRPPTLSVLHARLQASELPPIHVLHFDGHGQFDAKANKQAVLAFEDQKGWLNRVKGDDLARVLQGSSVRLVVLTACQSAMGTNDDAFSSIAAQLIATGVDAVIAMSTSIITTAAAHYAETFYRTFVSGVSALEAHKQAQQVLHTDPRRYTASRTLSENSTYVELQDWWLPHFYQRRPLILQVPPTLFIPEQWSRQPPMPLINRLSDDMPNAPRYGFSGRSHELLRIERSLQNKNVVVLSGFGGIGKTMLAREAADWLTQTRMYAGACFISFEHGGDTTTLLSALGHYLNIYDSHYNPQNLEAGLASLSASLEKQRILIIVDSLEYTLFGENRSLSYKAEEQLVAAIIKLKNMGAGILLTSRKRSLGAAWLPHRKQLTYVPLLGLEPKAAYELATNLLETLKIDRTKVSYAALQNLLQQLDYNPLSIQLVLPHLKQHKIETIQVGFARYLSDFVDLDSQETGRNRSLLDSLDYSLRQLSEEQQVLLQRLAPFESGAAEKELLAITQIPPEAWTSLRSRLEEVGLLVVEPMLHKVRVPFLRFHPVLVPYLRSQAATEDSVLLLRYTLHYCSLAHFLHREDRNRPQSVRDVAKREFPNLERALDRMLEMGQIGIATRVADTLGYFLMIAGQQYKRSIIMQCIATSTALSHTSTNSILTEGEYQRETSVSEYEFSRGNIQAAYRRFMALLLKIKSQPQEARLNNGSWEHCITLCHLSRCTRDSGNLHAAEEQMQEALKLIMILIKQEPENQNLVHQYGLLLTDLGTILVRQAQYIQAQEVLEEGLHYAQEQHDLRAQAVALGELGHLRLYQQEYAEAKTYYMQAKNLFNTLGEPDSEAVVWHQIGRIALEQKDWKEAESSFRKVIVIAESTGDELLVATTCNEIGLLTAALKDFSEAEEWFRRAIAIDERLNPRGSAYARDLGNLILTLLTSVDAGHFPITRLRELRDEAMHLLALYEAKEVRNVSEPIWQPLEALGTIAMMEEQEENKRKYYIQSKESFAAFAGNREKVDRQYGLLIALIAASTTGNAWARDKLVSLESENSRLHLINAIQHIWAGEREWYHLALDLDLETSLIVLRALEVLVMPMRIEPTDAEIRNQMIQVLVASLPETYQKLLVQDVGAAFTLEQAIEGFPPEEYSKAIVSLNAIIFYLKIHNRENVEEHDPSNIAKMVKGFEPLLRTIALVATGDTKHREYIEPELQELERMGSSLRVVAERIWLGERNLAELTAAMFLNDYDRALAQRILEFVNILSEIDKIMVSLPLPVRKAIELNNSYAIKQALETIERTASDEELQDILEKLERVNALVAAVQVTQDEEEDGEDLREEEKTEGIDSPKLFDSALWELAIALTGNVFDRDEIEDAIASLEEQVPSRAVALRQIWNGERDTSILTVGLSKDDTVFIQDLLAVIANLEALPPTLRQAVEQQDIVAWKRAFETLSAEEQKLALPVVRFMQISPEQVEEIFEPTLRIIAMVATGDEAYRNQAESVLTELELRGFHLTELVHRIWAGERDIRDLATSIKDHLEGKLVRRLLEIIEDLTAIHESQDSGVTYLKTSEMLKKNLDYAIHMGEDRDQAVVLLQLGTLALMHQEYDVALFYLHSARDLFHTLGELAAEAAALSNLGHLAEAQEKWADVEQYYRESFNLFKKSGDTEHAVEVCCMLGSFMLNTDQLAEAEYWWKQALKMEIHKDIRHVQILYDLAALLTQQMQQNSVPRERLTEARTYAEQALQLQEMLDDSSENWLTFNILATIADMEDQAERARDYRHQEREAYAAFEGNRTLIDNESGPMIAVFSAAARGEKRLRIVVEEALQAASNQSLADALQRILKGEREWISLTEDLNAKDALFVLRVLETINLPASSYTPLEEQLLTYVPHSVRQAWEDGYIESFEQAFTQLSPQEQQKLEGVKIYLLAKLEQMNLLRQCEPLLLMIAEASIGNQDRQEVLGILSALEEKGYYLREPVQQIWVGEHNREDITDCLDSDHAALIQRLLELIPLLTHLYSMTQEQIIASLPVTIQTSLLEQSDEFTIEQAFDSLSPEEQAYTEIVLHVLNVLQEKEDNSDEELSIHTDATETASGESSSEVEDRKIVVDEEEPQIDEVYQQEAETRNIKEQHVISEASESVLQFEPLLESIVAVANGDVVQRSRTEVHLAELEKQGWKIREVVQRFWRGERNIAVLTAGLDERDASLIRRIVELRIKQTVMAIYQVILERQGQETLGDLFDRFTPDEYTMALDTFRSLFPNFEAAMKSLYPSLELPSSEAHVHVEDAEDAESVIERPQEKTDNYSPDHSAEDSLEESVRENNFSEKNLVQFLDPLLLDIASIAVSDISDQQDLELELVELEKEGWQLKELAYRIWSGELDREKLASSARTNEMNETLILRILELRDILIEQNLLINSLPYPLNMAVQQNDSALIRNILRNFPVDSQPFLQEKLSSLNHLHASLPYRTRKLEMECYTAGATLSGSCMAFMHADVVHSLLEGKDIDREKCYELLTFYEKLSLWAKVLHIELIPPRYIEAMGTFLRIACTEDLQMASQYLEQFPATEDFHLPFWLSEAIIAKRKVAQNAGPDEYFTFARKLYEFMHYSQGDGNQVIALRTIIELLHKALTLFTKQGNVSDRIAPAIFFIVLVYKLATDFNRQDDVEQAFFWGEDVLLACVPPTPETESSLGVLTTNLLILCSLTARHSALDWFNQE